MTRMLFPLIAAIHVGAMLSLSASAQMADGDRGILPIDSEGLLEITGIEVDVEAESAEAARYAGWQIAQREGFAKLWARNKGRPQSQAPRLNDATLNSMVSAIVIENEQIGPTRYRATLGVLFDRARAGSLVGQSSVGRRSPPMLLIPLTVSGGTVTSVETRNPWQRAWAQFRTSESQIDYVRPSGLGVDPLLVNAAVTRRPDARWWRGVADYYQAANILIAEVTLHRAYPGGPARARFVARAGRDREVLGRFEMTAPDSEALPAMMERAVARMDEIYERAFRRGDLRGDRALIIRRARPVVEEVAEAPLSMYRVRLISTDGAALSDGLDGLRSVPGIEAVVENSLAIGGVSTVTITYRGDVDALRRALYARGWNAAYAGGTLTMSRRNDGPPPSAPVTQIELPPPTPQGQ
ncbi:heavy-metal-associated domain-containing protein [Sphingomicrobium clamense]|uniref:Heavy-metal-associated domain-containing protein n=1 Tax=Sphingomicrobium clamense TaxID=2851013 RepID=A0ABS6V5Z8_9SPHN|nr:heavy-metal-associated domain-containing protein [Sphingomicrobium sp. B8]MBW0144988.1 heavy-metal-associated domain-containing protein [Sphingomicrobium sp. B8]